MLECIVYVIAFRMGGLSNDVSDIFTNLYNCTEEGVSINPEILFNDKTLHLYIARNTPFL